MERTEYNELNESPTTIEKQAIYFSDNLNGNNFKEILNYYNSYHFDDHLDTIRNEYGCQSYSTIVFTINFLVKGAVKKFIISTAIIEIPDWNEVSYNNYPIGDEDVEESEKTINELLKKNYKTFIKAEMIIKFYINRSLDIIDQYNIEEEEELFDEGEPPIIESCFISDNCSVCLSSKPNILNLPCLHLSICHRCEEIGKLLRCLVCRKKIERKMKI